MNTGFDVASANEIE
jgi:ornithine decarboxylase